MDIANFKYLDEKLERWLGPFSLEALTTMFSKGTITLDTYVVDVRLAEFFKGREPPHWKYSQLALVSLKFEPSIHEFIKLRTDSAVTVLSGPNNCGKSLLLKQLYYWSDRGSYLVHCNRFSHVDVLNSRQLPEDQLTQYQSGFMQNFHTGNINSEDSPAKLEQVITGLSQPQLDKLFAMCGQMLNCKLEIKQIQKDRPFSPWYVDMDGQNLKLGSTGTRLLLVLIGLALDDNISTLFIDEPEMGLGPPLQAKIAKLLFDPEARKEHFPNLKQVVVATHSHLFLDKATYSNNWVVSKDSETVRVRQIDSIADLHTLQFRMLGNDLESMFLPSAIVIVEGDSDVTYLQRLFSLTVPERKISVARAGSDGEISTKLHFLKQVFGDLRTSPYRSRIFAVLDSRNSVKRSSLTNLGIDDANIIVWKKNGIEYYYPQSVVASVFRCSEQELTSCNLENDPIEFRGLRYSKKELAEQVEKQLAKSMVLPDELQSFIAKVASASS